MQSAFGDRFSSIRGIIGKIPVIYIVIAIVWVFSIAVIVVGSYIIYKSPKIEELLKKGRAGLQTEENKNIAEPFKPSPRPLATGKQTYLISGSTPGAPKMSEVTFDPIDPKSGQNQIVIVKALDVNGSLVRSVSVTLNTDNKSETHSLSLSQGTAQDGVWQGSWKISDSYDYKYTATFRAENAAELAQTSTLTLR